MSHKATAAEYVSAALAKLESKEPFEVLDYMARYNPGEYRRFLDLRPPVDEFTFYVIASVGWPMSSTPVRLGFRWHRHADEGRGAWQLSDGDELVERRFPGVYQCHQLTEARARKKMVGTTWHARGTPDVVDVPVLPDFAAWRRRETPAGPDEPFVEEAFIVRFRRDRWGLDEWALVGIYDRYNRKLYPTI